jgi:hypothetical protein
VCQEQVWAVEVPMQAFHWRFHVQPLAPTSLAEETLLFHRSTVAVVADV